MSFMQLPLLDPHLSSTQYPAVEKYYLQGRPVLPEKRVKPFNRVVFSAAHVVANPFACTHSSASSQIDWDRTIAYRRYLLEQGLGIAEAMDTAQRGMGLDWPNAVELVKQCIHQTKDIKNALIYSGVGTDHLDCGLKYSLNQVVDAYSMQLDQLQQVGSHIILMASRVLAHVAKSVEDYKFVYRKVLSKAHNPVILHWLGEMFDPSLKGYWGAIEFSEGMQTALEIIHENKSKINGIKISLLDKDKEIMMRRLLPEGVVMYTGDDFNYPELIEGDSLGYSHALLGVFDAIAPVAAQAMAELTEGNIANYRALLNPTLPLARLIFSTPTQYYKTGIVFLAYLNGHQDHFIMLAGHQSMRDLSYFVTLFKLADQANLLLDSERACARMSQFLQQYGWHV